MIRVLDATAGVEGGRTVATLVTLICALWILVVVARPLAGWKVLLVAAMAGVLAVIVAVPALATGIFLLYPTPLRVGTAAVIGAAGAALIELTHRGVAFAARNHGGPGRRPQAQLIPPRQAANQRNEPMSA